MASSQLGALAPLLVSHSLRRSQSVSKSTALVSSRCPPMFPSLQITQTMEVAPSCTPSWSSFRRLPVLGVNSARHLSLPVCRPKCVARHMCAHKEEDELCLMHDMAGKVEAGNWMREWFQEVCWAVWMREMGFEGTLLG